MRAPVHGDQAFSAARRLGMPLTHILDFSANINPVGPSAKALQRLRRDLGIIRFYPDTENWELRDLVSKQEGIDSDCILFGNGATHLLHLIPRVLKPRSAVVLEPGFSEYASALERAGCKIHRLLLRPQVAFQLDRETLFRTLDRSRPQLLILGNPNNPTGSILPPPLLSELTDACSKRRINLVLDESFIEFAPYRSRAVEATGRTNLVVVRSLTKFWALAGLRIGYLVAHKTLVDKLHAGSEPWSVNTLASSAAVESLRDLKYRSKTLDLIRRERTFLTEQLSRLPWLTPFPSVTNFLLVRITSPAITSAQLRESLEERNILIRDGANFPGLGRRYFRVAIRNRADNKRLIDELHILSRAVKHLSRRNP